MTTIYVPRLIESAEQAEALPDGTLAHGHWPDRQYGDGLVKKIGGAWIPRSVTGIGIAPSEALIGWSALVPIEAEEETVERHRLCQAVPDVLHRFTTPWTLYTAKETP